MSEDQIALPESVRKIEVLDKEVYLVGTAHVSKKSVEDVRTTIQALKPDTVAVELCEPRFNAMMNQDNWKKMNIFKIIREKKTVFFLAQLIMGAFYRRIGAELGVMPGAEMLEAIEQAKQTNAALVLADRKIEVTLKRVWGYLGFWNKMNMLSLGILSVFTKEEINEDLVEQMKEGDQLETVMKEFSEQYPEVKRRLLDERDVYLSQMIRHAPGKRIVAAVGAGHVGGIIDHIQQDEDLEEISQIPPKSIWPKILKWAIPAAIVALLVWGFFKNGKEQGVENLLIWILVNGVPSALGALIALAHPFTIIASFIAAPLTSINPMIGAGYVAAIVQAWICKPKVADFEHLHDAVTSVKGWWFNSVMKILLVFLLVSLGSFLGTWIATVWIGSRTI